MAQAQKKRSIIQNDEKTKQLRRLHAIAKDVYEMEDPHPLLHQLAVAEFEVKSMSHITAAEVKILIGKIESEKVNWDKVEALGVTRIPQMSDKQKWLVKRLQRELGWSDDYLDRLAFKRYGYMGYIYLTGRPAVAYVRYLIIRSRQKRGIKVT